jgi:hypothetical protein
MVHVLFPGVWMLAGLQTMVALIASVMVTVWLPPEVAAVSLGV